ncbi:unnamed protein product [Protopolystoma xenopodis]|uniref:alpha-1,2-Mannosidase n=1 Tax=Protopolystoma xenopodis TaxID=117903 RepID=A0A448XHI8_9PLAT|nr:unnamed protein product [Protopolystoma xenopodis]
MMKKAWDGYVNFAWGSNELRPQSKGPHNPDVLGTIPMGASIIDGMDTLYIMGMDQEFEAATTWVKNALAFDKQPSLTFF